MAAGRAWPRFAMMAARRGSPIPAGRSIQSSDASEQFHARSKYNSDHHHPGGIGDLLGRDCTGVDCVPALRARSGDPWRSSHHSREPDFSSAWAVTA
jgi:hypothetical protein